MTADTTLEIARLEKELRKSKAREEFLSMCMKAGDIPPCRNCGRIVLAGPACCEKPDLPEILPVGVPLEEYDKVVAQLGALQDLLAEYTVGDDREWVRQMLTEGFVPSMSNTKARKERDEAQREAQQWHDLISRLRTHLNIPYDATHEEAPKLVREALHKAQEQGAGWMRKALIEDVIALRGLHESRCTPSDVCKDHRPKEDPPLVAQKSARTKHKKVGLGSFTPDQLDRGCEVRWEQDYRSEMGNRAAIPLPYTTLGPKEKQKSRLALLQILKAVLG